MRWTVFAVFAFVALVLEVSVRNVLRLDSMYGVSPSFVGCLLMFILLFAQRMSALWGCWIMGVLMDLMPRADAANQLIGPAALGLVFGALVILPLRSMVFRKRLMTMGVLTFIFLLASAVATVSLLAVRSWTVDSGREFHGLAMLRFLALSAVYSGVLAWPVGWLLLLTTPVWGFQSAARRR